MMREIAFTKKIKAKIGAKKWKGFKYFMLAVPFLLFFVAFSYVPLLGWAYAFSDYKPGRLFYEINFTGLENFIRLLKDREMIRVLRNTLVMSFAGLLLSPVSVLLAIFMNDLKNAKVKRFIQTTITFPNFISWIVLFGLAQALFSANGMVNQLLRNMGVSVSQFGLMGDRKAVWFFQTMLRMWKSAGWGCIIYLAAITGIDMELYDAAKVDGANKLQQIRHITIPGILPTYLVLLLLDVSNILSNGFEQYYIFWNSMVADKIEVLDYYIYKIGMKNMQYSYGVAAGMIKSLIGIALLFLVNRISKRVRGSSLI